MIEPWQLEDFAEKIDEWIKLESPSQDIINEVLSWVFTRQETPVKGLKLQEGFDDLWFGPVPATVRGDTVVCCSCFVDTREKVVRCERFATLGMPV